MERRLGIDWEHEPIDIIEEENEDQESLYLDPNTHNGCRQTLTT